jgi:RNA polymerase sigma-70 factor (sigma-E family)
MELAPLMSEIFPPAGRGGAEDSDATITPITGLTAIVDPGTGSGDAYDQASDDAAGGDLDAALMPLTFEHGEHAFSDLYTNEHDRLVRLAYVLTGSREVAEDVVQDSFVRLYRRWRSAEHPDRYVRQIVVNECKSHHRRSGRERERRAMLYVVDSMPDRQGVELADVLFDLPYRQRAAIVLRYYLDLGENEIAEVLGCRPGTVGSLIHRGLEKLRKVIDE